MTQVLLVLHLLAGSFALIGAAVAIATEKGKSLHILAGRIYFWSMAAIFLTAIPLSIFKTNIFLLLIAMFSFYLAFSGWRLARNRKGAAELIDWLAIALIFLAGAGMWALAAFYFATSNSFFIVLLVFGLLALSQGYADYTTYKNKAATGKQRIARHLSNMLGGTIAVVTAVLVVNVDVEPRWVFWVLPTAVLTPVIIWWNGKVLK